MSTITFNDLPDETRKLYIKIKTLADRGIGGEKLNAIDLLNKFLAKHGLSYDNIHSIVEYKEWYKFSYVGGEWVEDLLFQIYGEVLDTHKLEYKRNKTNRQIWFELTPSEFAEITIKFDVYKKQYKIEQEKLFIAFCNANKIYPETPKQDLIEDDDLRPLTKEEVKHHLEMERKRKSGFYRQAGMMAMGMKKVEIQKRIGDVDNSD